MRVLITNDRLDRRPGSDLFIRDLARALQRLGHFVIAYGSDPRHQPRLLEVDSISVATDLANLPFRPDIIHSRHHLDAMTAVLALPGVPAVHHCIGPAWSAALPVHPGIHRYIAPSARVASWVASQQGAEGGPCDVLLNGVDLLRFNTVRQPAPIARRVLIYDDELSSDAPAVAAVERAAGDLGLECRAIGARLGRAVDDPETRLPDFDIVCARGAKAVEALASGCAVVTIGWTGCGELVGQGNFDRLRESDFSADGAEPTATAPDGVARAFRSYSAEACRVLAARTRSVCDFDNYARRIEEIYRDAIRANEGRVEDSDAEQRATARYLHELSCLTKGMDQIQKADGDIPLSTVSMFLDVAARLAAIQTDLDKPQW